MLKISPLAAECAQKAILVTGSARSGTTIVGKVVSSLEKVEYIFEPPTLFTVFSLVGNLNEHHWRLLYETYLYEEFLMNAFAGRNFNLNRRDDSAAYKFKSAEEIERRLNRSLSKADAEQLSITSTLAYKMPDIVPMVPALKAYYPNTQVVIVLRDAVGTINSVMQKKWFSKETEGMSLIWPFGTHKNLRVPFWVKSEDREYWTSLSELDKAAYYYVRMNEDLDKISNRIEVAYSRLIINPEKVVGDLVDQLGLRFGPKTIEIVESICSTEKDRDLYILEKINSDLRARVKYYSERSTSL